MSTPIKANKPKHEMLRQWGWFAALWASGLGVALTLGYTIKFLMGLI